MAKGFKAFVIALLVVLVAALAVGVTFFVYYYIDSSGQVKTFTLQYGSEEIASEKRNFELPRGAANIFECKALTKNDGYKVAITPAAGVKFDYIVDGMKQGYSFIEDLSPAFKVVKTEKNFSVYLPAGATIETVLQSLTPDKTVIVDASALAGKDLFCMTVTSGDTKKTIAVYFH